MSDHRSGQSAYLGYCLLAVILFGCYVLLNHFQDDNSATMAPNLILNRRRRACLFSENPTGSRPWLHRTAGQWIRLRPLLLLF